MKRFFATFLFLFFAFFCSAEIPDFKENIQIQIWSELDAFPELKEAQNVESGVFDYSIQRLKDVAPFLVNGMVYGWNFTYTPSDKLRNVKEYFEVEPIGKINVEENRIVFENPWIQDNLVHIWVKYKRTPEEMFSYKAWNSINVKKAQGAGSASVKLGFEGITEAAKNAVRDGIRNFYRPIIKNKPKEITGKLIIRKEPQIGIIEGRYSVKLDFFLETDRIIKYTMF